MTICQHFLRSSGSARLSCTTNLSSPRFNYDWSLPVIPMFIIAHSWTIRIFISAPFCDSTGHVPTQQRWSHCISSAAGKSTRSWSTTPRPVRTVGVSDSDVQQSTTLDDYPLDHDCEMSPSVHVVFPLLSISAINVCCCRKWTDKACAILQYSPFPEFGSRSSLPGLPVRDTPSLFSSIHGAA